MYLICIIMTDYICTVPTFENIKMRTLDYETKGYTN